MSRYKIVSNFRIIELLIVVGLISVLTGLALQDYRDFFKNSFALNFLMFIHYAKTDAAIDTAFYGVEDTNEHRVVHSRLGDTASTFKEVSVDNHGEIVLITPDRNSDFWNNQQFEKVFVERQISMYIHKTGTQAYGFSFLSCNPNPKNSYSKTSYSDVKKLDKTYYKFYCQ